MNRMQRAVQKVSEKYISLLLQFQNQEISRPWLSSEDICMLAEWPTHRKQELLDILREQGMIRLDRQEAPDRSRIWTINATGTGSMEEIEKTAQLCDEMAAHCGQRLLGWEDVNDGTTSAKALMKIQETRNNAIELRERLQDQAADLYVQRQVGDLDNRDIGGPYDLWTETHLLEFETEDDEYVDRYIGRRRP